MKIDNREDALTAAGPLVGADVNRLADALLEAFLEGIDQARSLFHQHISYQQIGNDLEARSKFIRTQISK